MHDYELLDAGDGARLERFGPHVVDRPHAGALAPRRTPEAWAEADLRFDRDRGWSGAGLPGAGLASAGLPGAGLASAGLPGAGLASAGLASAGLPGAADDWTCRLWDIAMRCRPTDSGQVGVFPEHAARFAWLADQVERRTADASAASAVSAVSVLNLFAYTGLATLRLAAWGAAVTHVDASRPSVTWARENAVTNDLADRPIRWIVDDVRRYARRELRRGRRYDGIILDPPAYGHGGASAAWQLDVDLADLLDTCAALLADDGFLLLTTHTEGFGAERLGAMLRAVIANDTGHRHERGDVELTARSGVRLALGAYATVTGRP